MPSNTNWARVATVTATTTITITTVVAPAGYVKEKKTSGRVQAVFLTSLMKIIFILDNCT